MGVSNTSKFFEHIGKALSEASANIKTHEKAGNKSDEIMWRKTYSLSIQDASTSV